MSKTFRRKKVRDSKILRDICMYRGGSITGDCRVAIQCSSDCPYKDKEYTLSKYRRDTHVGYGYSVPKKICKEFNRIRRAKGKAEVNRIWREEDYEEYQFDPWVKDAGWYYW